MTRIVVVVLPAALAVVGCVNDYVVGDDDGTTGNATEGTGDTGSGTAQGDTTKGTAGDDTSDAGTGPADPTATGGDTGASAFTCEPCTADAECGDAYDNCVDLGDVGPRCLISCPEAGCEPGSDCMDATSVDGFVVPQCVPLAPDCA